MKRFRFSQLALIAVALLGCTSKPAEVGSNRQSLTVDKVDILLVVDDSGSMHGFRDEELPRLVNAFISGSDPEVGDLPRIDNVHVAVVSTNLGAGEELWDIEQPEGMPVPADDELPPSPGEDAMTAEMMAPEDAGMAADPTERESGSIPGCEGRGDDGVFAALTGDDIDRCAAQFPSFVSLDRGTAVLATTETISCLPALESMGCGFEQPLEAALKSLWPASNPAVEFLYGAGHGESENEGFLREDSLLIVIVITDEDDCSAEDPQQVFVPDSLLPPGDPLAAQGLNIRCSGNPDRLYDRARYLENLTGLRPDNDNVMFVTIAGIPPELVSEEAQAEVDASDTQERNAYFDSILEAPSMQIQIDDRMTTYIHLDDNLVPSCTKPGGENAFPPRRLVQLAKDFGARAVLGSLCEEDFGPVVGRILRTAAERIDAAPAAEE